MIHLHDNGTRRCKVVNDESLIPEGFFKLQDIKSAMPERDYQRLAVLCRHRRIETYAIASSNQVKRLHYWVKPGTIQVFSDPSLRLLDERLAAVAGGLKLTDRQLREADLNLRSIRRIESALTGQVIKRTFNVTSQAMTAAAEASENIAMVVNELKLPQAEPTGVVDNPRESRAREAVASLGDMVSLQRDLVSLQRETLSAMHRLEKLWS